MGGMCYVAGVAGVDDRGLVVVCGRTSHVPLGFGDKRMTCWKCGEDVTVEAYGQTRLAEAKLQKQRWVVVCDVCFMAAGKANGGPVE